VRLESLAESLVLELFETLVYLLVSRFDILVEREEVGRVIPVLEGHQPFIVDPISGSIALQKARVHSMCWFVWLASSLSHAATILMT
jgi:hypothetical protein